MLVLSSLVLLAALFKHSVLCEDTCKCVGELKEQEGPCGDGVCHTLMDYAAFQGNFSSNTTFKFLPGDHVLEEIYISVTRVHNLTFTGLENDTDDDSANVLCIGKNAGFFFENIEYLTITNMGFKHCGFLHFKNYTQAFLMRYVKNLQLSHVVIYNSSGFGLIAYNLQGNSLIDSTTIDLSHNKTGYLAGNLRIQYRNYSAIGSHNLVITNSNFQNGTPQKEDNRESYASGIDILLATTESIYITLRNVTLTGNRARSGGNLALTYVHLTQSTTWPSSVVIDNCTLSNGSAFLGGGMYMSMVARQNESTNDNHSVVIVHISNTYIQNNEAYVVGAGMYIQLYEEVALSTGANITIESSHFLSNTIEHLVNGRGGVALSILNFQIPGYLHHRMPQYTISVTSCNFLYNSVGVLSEDSVGSGTLFVEENAVTILKDNVFAHNHCTGIVAVRSNLKLRSNTTIWNNTGNNGGGMVLCDNSLLYLSGDVTVNITRNKALSYGGGIYAEFECTQAIPPCFFQMDQVKNKKVYLDQNSANKAGTALYGGSIGYCYLFGLKEQNSTRVFFNVFNVTPNDPSSISSNPLRVCFCYPNSTEKNCHLTHLEHSIYPGGVFTVALVVVGQRNGTVPGVVVASNVTGKYKTQSVETNQCKNLSYSLSSTATRNFTDKVFINLAVQNTDFRDVIDNIVHTVTIPVNLMSCPPGFDLQENHTAEDQYGCMCLKVLKESLDEIICDVKNTTIHKSFKSSWWLGFKSTDNGSEIVFSKFCPFDYCYMRDVYINVSQPESADNQCAFNREGPMCGRCKKNLSIVFGSFHCVDCRSNHSVLRVLGRIVLFSVLGIVFVFILGVLDITVTEGTLNAMIFYMNVVGMNHTIFIGSPNNLTVKLLRMFVLLMNLTTPYEFCFYDGMDSFVKTILHFLFPFYLLFLAGVIIFLCRKSPLVSKIVGENAVKILATIILFSYAKILRVVIDSANHTTLNYGNGSTSYVWTMDGNIPFWSKKHAFLFAGAILIAAITLPYTLSLLFIQCLRKRSHMKVLFWVNKLKPFFDAYTGPYKDRYHFWTGFLLIIRIVLFVSIATNTSKGPILSLTLIGTTTSILLLLIKPGLYRKWQLTAIEAFTYFNLIIFSFETAYVITDNDSKDKPTVICIGSMFLLFCGVVIYHVYKKFSDTQWWGKMKVWLLDKRWPWMKRKPIRSLILNHSGVDDLSSSDSELDPILGNAPPVIRYDEYREPLVETGEYM